MLPIFEEIGVPGRIEVDHGVEIMSSDPATFEHAAARELRQPGAHVDVEAELGGDRVVQRELEAELVVRLVEVEQHEIGGAHRRGVDVIGQAEGTAQRLRDVLQGQRR